MDPHTMVGAVVAALNVHRAQTGMTLEPAHLEVRIHPEDVATLKMAADQVYFNMQQFLDEKPPFGIPWIEDSDIEPGHPVLKSTWQVTLL